MGFALKGTCHQSQAQAIEAFKADYPMLSGTNVLYLTSAASDGTTGIKFSLRNEMGVLVVTDGVVQFQSCDAATSGFGAIPLQSILFVLALFFAAAIGFFNGWNMKR